MLLPKSICVCIPCFKFVAPRVCMGIVPFFAYFLGAWHEYRSGSCHMHALKTFPRLY